MSQKLSSWRLDDLSPGISFSTAGRTITETDIVIFSGLSGDYAPLHTDETWMRENHPFGTRIAHGMLVASASYSLRTPILDNLDVVAWLETSRRFVSPVFPGDTIVADWEIMEVRQSKSNQQVGVVTADITVRTERGIVQKGTDVWLVSRKSVQEGAD
jgi:3-hydroxybutyryl-CoA dehydratase